MKNKKQKKTKSGDGADDVYASKWVYFGRLKFLDDYITAKRSRSNLQVMFYTYTYFKSYCLAMVQLLHQN